MREEKTEGPLVCSLNSRELVRRSGEISKLIEGSLECIERPDGFDLSFPGDEQTARLLLDFILKERPMLYVSHFRNEVRVRDGVDRTQARRIPGGSRLPEADCRRVGGESVTFEACRALREDSARPHRFCLWVCCWPGSRPGLSEN